MCKYYESKQDSCDFEGCQLPQENPKIAMSATIKASSNGYLLETRSFSATLQLQFSLHITYVYTYTNT